MSNLAMMMGLGSGAGAIGIADVFSTTLYTGNSTDDTKITTGVDTNTNGGIIWTKRRNSSDHHLIFDTENAFDGALSGSSAKGLRTNDPAGEASYSGSLKSFDTDGYTIGTSYTVNNGGTTYASWTWVKQEGYFDIQNYSGTGSTQTLSHNLNADVGMIFIKQLTGGNADWSVYHRSLGGTKNMRLDSDRAVVTNNGYFADTDATSTEFTVGPLGDFNTSGRDYVAYLFAHNEDLIQCGTYTGNSNANGPEIELGWQPQWLLIKNTSAAGNWNMFDSERGIVDGGNDPVLYSDLTNSEDGGNNYLKLTTTGFQLESSSPVLNDGGKTYIYMAIKAED